MAITPNQADLYWQMLGVQGQMINDLCSQVAATKGTTMQAVKQEAYANAYAEAEKAKQPVDLLTKPDTILGKIEAHL